MTEKFSTPKGQLDLRINLLDEFHDKVDSEVILEHILHVDYKWMIYCVQYVFFKLDVFELLIIYHYIFSDALHRVYLLAIFFLNEENLAESTFSNHSKDLKIL